MSPSSSYSTSSSSSSPRNDDGLLDATSAQALLQEHEQVVSAKRTSFSSNPDSSSQDVKRIRSLTSLLPLSQEGDTEKKRTNGDNRGSYFDLLLFNYRRSGGMATAFSDVSRR